MLKENPGKVYDLIKTRLLEFQETIPEKRSRYLFEFSMMNKGQLTAHQWQPVFEEGLTNLASVGMSRNENEAFIAYVTKSGPRLTEIILKDYKMRSDSQGRQTWRTPQTWQEAHKSVIEHEATQIGQRALLRTYRATGGLGWDVHGQAGSHLMLKGQSSGKGGKSQVMAALVAAIKGKSKGKGKGKGRGKGKGSGKGKGKGKGGKPACHAMRDHNYCAKGSNCWYSHEEEVIKAARRETNERNRRAKLSAATSKGKPKAKERA